MQSTLEYRRKLHVAIIMDGNGRWATARGLARPAGHRAGVETVRRVCEAAPDLGITTLTRFAFSSDNWRRPPAEVRALMALLRHYLRAEIGKLIDNGTVATPAGSGPRHLAFHPSERWAYVMNELGVSVTTLDFDKGTGKLSVKATVSALPAGQSAAGVSGAEIFAHPNGKVVYASTRSFNTIAVFDVNADGTLTLRANVPTGGDRPRSFALDPDATLLYAANQDQQAIVGFKIDATTGGLTTIGKVVDVPSPAFVGLAKIP